MKTIKFKLTKSELENCVQVMVKVYNAYKPFTLEECVNYLNFQSICVKFINKNRTSVGVLQSKQLAITANVNEVLSIQQALFDLQITLPESSYVWNTFSRILIFTKKEILHNNNAADNILLKLK